MNKVIIGLGSNLGNKEKNLQKAIHLLADEEFIEIKKVSSFYETEAVAKIKQPKFLNAVLIIQTILSPLELLETTKTIEKKLGRTSKGTYDPRTCDIDILFYNQEIICLDELTIPHPLLHERTFVLKPLYEIAPDFIHPLFEKTISELYNETIQSHH